MKSKSQSLVLYKEIQSGIIGFMNGETRVQKRELITMLNGQIYANEIKHVLCDIFLCERNGFGGIVNSDFIRTHPYTTMVAGLAYLAATVDDKKRLKLKVLWITLVFIQR